MFDVFKTAEPTGKLIMVMLPSPLPHSLLEAAGLGDMEAQQSLAAEAERLFTERGDILAAVEGLMLARMMAARGIPAEKARLVRILGSIASLTAAIADLGEFIGHVRRELAGLADEGSEEAAAALMLAYQASAPNVLTCASRRADQRVH